MGDVLFIQRDGTYVPTDLAIGPWSRELLHGGAVGALLVTLLEGAGEPEYTSVRLTTELVRPVGLVPLGVEVRPVRQGRRLEVLEGIARADGNLLARTTLLRIRETDVTLPEGAGRPLEEPPDLPDDLGIARSWETPSFFESAVEVRVADPDAFIGADRGWFRLHVPVLEGRDPSPMARVAAAADFGNGISSRIPSFDDRRLTFVNASLDVHLFRPLEGEWVRLDATSIWRPNGLGLTRTELADPVGELGVAHQTLVLA